MSLKAFAESLPDYAKDIRLNLTSILSDELLGEERKNGLLLSCAHGSGYKPLVEAAEAEVEGKLSESQANAARGAAALMAMNNVYYRFVHLVANPEYGTMPAKLRMNFIASHGIAKEEFELFSLAISAMNGCGMCIDSHERVLLDHGVKSDVIQSAVRIAAVMKALATVHATL
ncbi:carboxymuconolactone decarboxylase family protein [Sphingomonas sp. RG327]|uniref:Alkyl hydroperoxide reductase AhpD n=1 Tax=Sphingomonas anseongensis TaxID=2908207 RepID=A0ABT0RCT2_9SPHN|nr:carboxymuconolactone decarboxylase family protein [Sphingomonas anseongensis]MCL6677870.1 carboxymuconolactone decarboxylase family protein [Sphingomonas anseongensis]